MPLAAQPVNVDLADWLAHQSGYIVQRLESEYCADSPRLSGGELPTRQYDCVVRTGG